MPHTDGAQNFVPEPEISDLAGLAAGGTYVLWLHLPRFRRIGVGRLGQIDLASGYYGYVGSAQGPGGLGARVGRHLKGSPKLRWHIDYLRRFGVPTAVWYCVSPRRWEHDWAQALAAMPGARLAAPGFGASDCRCPAHLVGRADLPAPQAFLQTLKKAGAVPPTTLMAVTAARRALEDNSTFGFRPKTRSNESRKLRK